VAGPPPPFSGDDLKPVLVGLPERDGLDESQFADAVCQFLQGDGIELPPRLVGIGFYLVQSYLVDGRAALCAD